MPDKHSIEDKDLNDDNVKLVEYSIVSIASGEERVLPAAARQRIVLAESTTGDDFIADRIARYRDEHSGEVAAGDDRYLRVAYRVLDRWPRQASRPESEARRPAQATRRRRPAKAAKVAEPRRPAKAAGTTAPATAAPKMAGDERRVLEALAARGGSAAMAELVAETGMSRAALRRLLQPLMARGSVLRVGQGLKTRYRRT